MPPVTIGQPADLPSFLPPLPRLPTTKLSLKGVPGLQRDSGFKTPSTTWSAVMDLPPRRIMASMLPARSCVCTLPCRVSNVLATRSCKAPPTKAIIVIRDTKIRTLYCRDVGIMTLRPALIP